jgi:hypothetical protein
METNRLIMSETITELESLLCEIPSMSGIGGEHTDSKLPAVLCKVLRCIGDRLSDIENKMGIK